MNTELAVVLALLVSAVAMFVINKPRMDAVALIMLTALPFTGVVTMGETLAGFHSAVLKFSLTTSARRFGHRSP